MMAVSLAQACDKVEFAYDKGRLQCPQGWSSTPNTPTSFILTEEIIGVCVWGGFSFLNPSTAFLCVFLLCVISLPLRKAFLGQLKAKENCMWKLGILGNQQCT